MDGERKHSKYELEWTRPAVETFNRESFELCARKNLEHALEVVEAAAELEPPGKLPRIRHESAAATIRELLQPESHYFEAAPAA